MFEHSEISEIFLSLKYGFYSFLGCLLLNRENGGVSLTPGIGKPHP